MIETRPDVSEILQQRGVLYVVDEHQQQVAVLVSLEIYAHYQKLLAEEASLHKQPPITASSQPTPA